MSAQARRHELIKREIKLTRVDSLGILIGSMSQVEGAASSEAPCRARPCDRGFFGAGGSVETFAAVSLQRDRV
jgi:hypothetical protein